MPGLIAREQLDLVVANGENSAAGSGITPDIYRELIAAGVDCITLGDHIYKRREIICRRSRSETEHRQAGELSRRVRRARPWPIVTARDGTQVAVISLLGRVFMRPVDCPWHGRRSRAGEVAARREGDLRRLPRRGDERQAS